MSKIACDTKQKLIDTALALIWTSSYGSVSVDDICKSAGVKKGSFYHFFPSKVDLAIAAMELSYQAMKPSLDAIFSSKAPALERFERFAEFTFEQQREAAAKYGHVCGCPCASLGSEMAAQEPLVRQKFEQQAVRVEQYYEDAVRDLVAEGMLPKETDVKVKAEEIYVFVLGQLMIARIQNDLSHLQRDIKSGLMRTLGVREKAAVNA